MTPEGAKKAVEGLLRFSSDRSWRLRRYMMLPHLCLALMAGLGPHLDGESFTSPLFDTFRDIAPLSWWGNAWLLIAAGLCLSWRSTRFWIYTAAHIGLTMMATFWVAVLVKARFFDHIDASATAFGLWLVPAAYGVIALVTAGDEERWT